MPAERNRLVPWLAVAVIGAAAVLRFWALRNGLPQSPQVDEPEIITRVLTMMRTGNFNPQFFDYPGLVIYLHLIVGCVHFVIGSAMGAMPALDQVRPADLYVWSRAVTATLGTLTVLLVYRIGSRVSGGSALFAALLVAVYPSHVRESHYVLTDVPLTFLFAATWLGALRMRDRPGLGLVVVSGVLAGLATSAKYPGVFAFVLPLLAIWTPPRRPATATRDTVIVLVSGAAVFIATSPYTVLDLPGFLNGFWHLAAAYHTGGKPGEPAGDIYVKHFHINGGFGFYYAIGPALLFACWRLISRPYRPMFLMALVTPLLLYFFLSHQNNPKARYLLPMLPFLAVLVGALAARVLALSVVRRMPTAWRVAVAAAVIVLLAAQPANQAIGGDHDLARVKTLDLASRWIYEHIPPGAKIGLEARAMLLPDGYDGGNIPKLIVSTYDDYAAQKFDYLVANSQSFGPAFEHPQENPTDYAAYRALFGQMQEVARFDPSTERPGPTLRIFRLIR